ncbi:MAG: hypothetical protein Q8K58_10250 [Acidimicrobiales bacterium]|nr:hypothetical protein [Acidimicrobiales bacterium]
MPSGYGLISLGLGLAVWAASRRGHLGYRFAGEIRSALVGLVVAGAGPIFLPMIVDGIRADGYAGFASGALVVVAVLGYAHSKARSRFPTLGRILVPALAAVCISPWLMGAVLGPAAPVILIGILWVVLRFAATGRVR